MNKRQRLNKASCKLEGLFALSRYTTGNDVTLLVEMLCMEEEEEPWRQTVAVQSRRNQLLSILAFFLPNKKKKKKG